MDRRITAHVLQFLLEHRFESKAEMARQLGMQPRTLEKVFANMGEAKASTTAFSKAVYYCAKHRISLDRILESFIKETEGGIAMGAYHQRACQRLEIASIARRADVDESAVRRRLIRLHKRLKKILK